MKTSPIQFRHNPRCIIKGLAINPKRIIKVDDVIEYDFQDLDLLLMNHKDKIKFKTLDELFLALETLDVIEYKGKSYAIELAA